MPCWGKNLQQSLEDGQLHFTTHVITVSHISSSFVVDHSRCNRNHISLLKSGNGMDGYALPQKQHVIDALLFPYISLNALHVSLAVLNPFNLLNFKLRCYLFFLCSYWQNKKTSKKRSGQPNSKEDLNKTVPLSATIDLWRDSVSCYWF